MVLVSVIIPTFNTKNYIIKSIQSIVNQSFGNWELIVIDDASTDGTYDIVHDYITKNNLSNKIKIIKNPKNKGCYYSLNLGITKSKGAFICWMGSDDVYHKDKLKIQSRILLKNKRAIATTSLYKRNKKTNGYLHRAACTVMFRRQVLKKIGYFDSVRFAADDEFMIRLFKVYGRRKIKFYKKVLYFAIIRPNSLTTSKKTGFKKPFRRQYVRQFKRWHRRRGKKLFIPFPLTKRPFNAPKIML